MMLRYILAVVLFCISSIAATSYQDACPILNCGRHSHCTQRTSSCNDTIQTCPSMTYCASNIQELTIGPRSCKKVLCSRKYACAVGSQTYNGKMVKAAYCAKVENPTPRPRPQSRRMSNRPTTPSPEVIRFCGNTICKRREVCQLISECTDLSCKYEARCVDAGSVRRFDNNAQLFRKPSDSGSNSKSTTVFQSADSIQPVLQSQNSSQPELPSQNSSQPVFPSQDSVQHFRRPQRLSQPVRRSPYNIYSMGEEPQQYPIYVRRRRDVRSSSRIIPTDGRHNSHVIDLRKKREGFLSDYLKATGKFHNTLVPEPKKIIWGRQINNIPTENVKNQHNFVHKGPQFDRAIPVGSKLKIPFPPLQVKKRNSVVSTSDHIKGEKENDFSLSDRILDNDKISNDRRHFRSQDKRNSVVSTSDHIKGETENEISLNDRFLDNGKISNDRRHFRSQDKGISVHYDTPLYSSQDKINGKLPIPYVTKVYQPELKGKIDIFSLSTDRYNSSNTANRKQTASKILDGDQTNSKESPSLRPTKDQGNSNVIRSKSNQYYLPREIYDADSDILLDINAVKMILNHFKMYHLLDEDAALLEKLLMCKIRATPSLDKPQTSTDLQSMNTSHNTQNEPEQKSNNEKNRLLPTEKKIQGQVSTDNRGKSSKGMPSWEWSKRNVQVQNKSTDRKPVIRELSENHDVPFEVPQVEHNIEKKKRVACKKNGTSIVSKYEKIFRSNENVLLNLSRGRLHLDGVHHKYQPFNHSVAENGSYNDQNNKSQDNIYQQNIKILPSIFTEVNEKESLHTFKANETSKQNDSEIISELGGKAEKASTSDLKKQSIKNVSSSEEYHSVPVSAHQTSDDIKLRDLFEQEKDLKERRGKNTSSALVYSVSEENSTKNGIILQTSFENTSLPNQQGQILKERGLFIINKTSERKTADSQSHIIQKEQDKRNDTQLADTEVRDHGLEVRGKSESRGEYGPFDKTSDISLRFIAEASQQRFQEEEYKPEVHLKNIPDTLPKSVLQIKQSHKGYTSNDILKGAKIENRLALENKTKEEQTLKPTYGKEKSLHPQQERDPASDIEDIKNGAHPAPFPRENPTNLTRNMSSSTVELNDTRREFEGNKTSPITSLIQILEGSRSQEQQHQPAVHLENTPRIAPFHDLSNGTTGGSTAPLHRNSTNQDEKHKEEKAKESTTSVDILKESVRKIWSQLFSKPRHSITQDKNYSEPQTRLNKDQEVISLVTLGKPDIDNSQLKTKPNSVPLWSQFTNHTDISSTVSVNNLENKERATYKPYITKLTSTESFYLPKYSSENLQTITVPSNMTKTSEGNIKNRNFTILPTSTPQYSNLEMSPYEIILVTNLPSSTVIDRNNNSTPSPGIHNITIETVKPMEIKAGNESLTVTDKHEDAQFRVRSPDDNISQSEDILPIFPQVLYINGTKSNKIDSTVDSKGTHKNGSDRGSDEDSVTLRNKDLKPQDSNHNTNTSSVIIVAEPKKENEVSNSSFRSPAFSIVYTARRNQRPNSLGAHVVTRIDSSSDMIHNIDPKGAIGQRTTTPPSDNQNPPAQPVVKDSITERNGEPFVSGMKSKPHVVTRIDSSYDMIHNIDPKGAIGHRTTTPPSNNQNPQVQPVGEPFVSGMKSKPHVVTRIDSSYDMIHDIDPKGAIGHRTTTPPSNNQNPQVQPVGEPFVSGMKSKPHVVTRIDSSSDMVHNIDPNVAIGQRTTTPPSNNQNPQVQPVGEPFVSGMKSKPHVVTRIDSSYDMVHNIDPKGAIGQRTTTPPSNNQNPPVQPVGEPFVSGMKSKPHVVTRIDSSSDMIHNIDPKGAIGQRTTTPPSNNQNPPVQPVVKDSITERNGEPFVSGMKSKPHVVTRIDSSSDMVHNIDPKGAIGHRTTTPPSNNGSDPLNDNLKRPAYGNEGQASIRNTYINNRENYGNLRSQQIPPYEEARPLLNGDIPPQIYQNLRNQDIIQGPREVYNPHRNSGEQDNHGGRGFGFRHMPQYFLPPSEEIMPPSRNTTPGKTLYEPYYLGQPSGLVQPVNHQYPWSEYGRMPQMNSKKLIKPERISQSVLRSYDDAPSGRMPPPINPKQLTDEVGNLPDTMTQVRNRPTSEVRPSSPEFNRRIMPHAGGIPYGTDQQIGYYAQQNPAVPGDYGNVPNPSNPHFQDTSRERGGIVVKSNVGPQISEPQNPYLETDYYTAKKFNTPVQPNVEYRTLIGGEQMPRQRYPEPVKRNNFHKPDFTQQKTFVDKPEETESADGRKRLNVGQGPSSGDGRKLLPFSTDNIQPNMQYEHSGQENLTIGNRKPTRGYPNRYVDFFPYAQKDREEAPLPKNAFPRRGNQTRLSRLVGNEIRAENVSINGKISPGVSFVDEKVGSASNSSKSGVEQENSGNKLPESQKVLDGNNLNASGTVLPESRKIKQHERAESKIVLSSIPNRKKHNLSSINETLLGQKSRAIRSDKRVLVNADRYDRNVTQQLLLILKEQMFPDSTSTRSHKGISSDRNSSKTVDDNSTTTVNEEHSSAVVSSKTEPHKLNNNNGNIGYKIKETGPQHVNGSKTSGTNTTHPRSVMHPPRMDQQLKRHETLMLYASQQQSNNRSSDAGLESKHQAKIVEEPAQESGVVTQVAVITTSKPVHLNEIKGRESGRKEENRDRAKSPDIHSQKESRSITALLEKVKTWKNNIVRISNDRYVIKD